MATIPTIDPREFDAVAIGASTGSPNLVETIISGLPADLSVPVFVALHLPPKFTVTFATQLEQRSALTVVHGENGQPVYNGVAYIGQGHMHMRVRKSLGGKINIEIGKEPEHKLFRPSADVLFQSCAQVYGRKTLAIVLSGIGHDGTEGAVAVQEAGGMVLTQRSDTCPAPGMPTSCEKAGVSDVQLTPEDIRRVILQLSPKHGGEAAA